MKSSRQHRRQRSPGLPRKFTTRKLMSWKARSFNFQGVCPFLFAPSLYLSLFVVGLVDWRLFWLFACLLFTRKILLTDVCFLFCLIQHKYYLLDENGRLQRIICDELPDGSMSSALRSEMHFTAIQAMWCNFVEAHLAKRARKDPSRIARVPEEGKSEQQSVFPCAGRDVQNRCMPLLRLFQVLISFGLIFQRRNLLWIFLARLSPRHSTRLAQITPPVRTDRIVRYLFHTFSPERTGPYFRMHGMFPAPTRLVRSCNVY